MPDMPRTKFNSPWTVENIEAELNGTKNARGNLTMTEKLAQKVETSTYATDKAAIDAEIAEDRAALAEVENKGAKNRLNYHLATFGDKSKITINQDGSITGSITSDTRPYTWENREFEFKLPAGDYAFLINRLAGDGAYTSARLMTAENANICSISANPNIAPSMRSFTLNTEATIGFIGKVFTDTIQLMLCTKAEWDISHEYKPYALPNPTLTPAAIKAVDEGAKNKLQLFQLGSSNANVGNPCTSQGVEYEIQSDGTITAYRKSSASSGAYIFLYKNGALQNLSEFFDGNHIWSGNPSQYPDGGVLVWYKIGSGSNITLPNGALLPNANGETVQIGIQISTALSPTQSNPIVFRPMICTAADWAVSQKFVPYAPTNRELYEDLQTKVTLVKVFGRGVGISNNDDLNTYQTLGRYCASNGTIAASLSNCPVTTGFVLTVTESFQTNGGIVQTIETLVSGETQVDIYKRMRIYRNNAWSWGDWYKFEGTAVSTQSAPASLMQAGRIDAELTDAGTLTKGEEPETESREEER